MQWCAFLKLADTQTQQYAHHKCKRGGECSMPTNGALPTHGPSLPVPPHARPANLPPVPMCQRRELSPQQRGKTG